MRGLCRRCRCMRRGPARRAAAHSRASLSLIPRGRGGSLHGVAVVCNVNLRTEPGSVRAMLESAGAVEGSGMYA